VALRFADSFDHYATADMGKKYSLISTSGSIAIQSEAGRNGTNGLHTTRTDAGPELYLDSRSVWIVGFSFRTQEFPSSSMRGILAFSDSGTLQCSVGFNNSGQLELRRGSDTGTLLGTGSTNLSASTTYYLEFKVTVHNTAGGAVFKVNGVTETITWVSGGSTTQDTAATANNTANQILVHGSGTTSALDMDRDDLYICDTSGSVNNDFLGDVRVEALLPSGAGYSTMWTATAGSNYQCVDEAAANGDTDYVYEATTDDIDSYAMGNLSATSGTIVGLQTVLWARKDDAGTRAVKPHFYIGGTPYARTAVNLQDTYVAHRAIEETSPATASAWSISEINALEFGAKVG
jgi:hypothetical protein